MTFLKGTLGCLLLALAGWACALTPEQALRIADGESDDRITALNEVVASGDAALKPFIEALLADEVKVGGGKVFIVKDEVVLDAASGTATKLPDDAQDVVNNNRMSQALGAALAAFNLSSPDRAVRAKAIADMKDSVDEGLAALVDGFLCTEQVKQAAAAVDEQLAHSGLGDDALRDAIGPRAQHGFGAALLGHGLGQRALDLQADAAYLFGGLGDAKACLRGARGVGATGVEVVAHDHDGTQVGARFARADQVAPLRRQLHVHLGQGTRCRLLTVLLGGTACGFGAAHCGEVAHQPVAVGGHGLDVQRHCDGQVDVTRLFAVQLAERRHSDPFARLGCGRRGEGCGDARLGAQHVADRSTAQLHALFQESLHGLHRFQVQARQLALRACAHQLVPGFDRAQRQVAVAVLHPRRGGAFTLACRIDTRLGGAEVVDQLTQRHAGAAGFVALPGGVEDHVLVVVARGGIQLAGDEGQRAGTGFAHRLARRADG